MESEVLTGVAAAPFIAALISYVVKPFITDGRVYPVAAIVLGIAYEVGAKLQNVQGLGDLTWFAAVVLGTTIGFAASGIYAGSQTARSALSGTGGG